MLESANINICDNPAYSGNLRDIDEILTELRKELDGFSTHAMSDHALYLQGKRDALCDVIAYLERVA